MDELEVILQYLVQIDKAQSEDEMDSRIYGLLESMGKYTGADRAYIFEKVKPTGAFSNTYEWCAEGIVPQIGNLQVIKAEEIQYWHQTFLRGDNIVIENLEDIKDIMPQEYEILKLQDIVTEISFPIFCRDQLIGFIGVDNPQIGRSQKFINLLSIVGGYLGGIWGRTTADKLLESNRASLARSREELEQALEETKAKNEIISAIGKIYYTIYHIDLVSDIYEEIAADSENHSFTGRRGVASRQMKKICRRFVADEYQDRLLEFFDLSTVGRRLRDDDTVAVEYRAKDGNWHLARFIVQKRDARGEVSEILYATRIINDTKRREQNWIIVAEEANRQNEAKTDFLSRMAHDIRTPMNAIRGFTRITRNNINDPAAVASGLEKIDRAGKYLQQIVDDILDLGRIESGELILHPEPVKISEIFQDFAETVEGVQLDKLLNISCRLENILHDEIIADPLRIRQIYMNLLSNAMKYTPDGGNVWFQVSEEELPGERVRLISTVRDNGIGMSREYMEQMYSKFTRAVDTRINKVRGSGLGLAIVKNLVDMMDGTIEVKSELDKGSEFRVILDFPCAEECEKDTENEEIKEDNSGCEGMHLLVAEDNDLNYEVTSELLAMYRITCERAENGAVCVEKFRSLPGRYHAILMDMQMPVMDGVTATRKIRELEMAGDSHIPIIAVTANAFNIDIERCKKAGMDAHLSKPFEITQLLRLIKKAGAE